MHSNIIVLDRDGVLNIDRGYTYEIKDLEIPAGVIHGLKRLQKYDRKFVVATGQSGINRKKYSVQQMRKFNASLFKQLKSHGITITALAFCPHHPDEGCSCRKPKTGMLKLIEKEIGKISWSQAIGIGDKPNDSKMMLAMGGYACLLKNGPHNNSTGEEYWNLDKKDLQDLLFHPRHMTCEDFADAVDMMIQRFATTHH